VEVERSLLERRLAEQDILRQSLEEKNAKIKELEVEVRTLRDLLNSAVVSQRPAYAPAVQPQRRFEVPRRWSVTR
jgi:hypothetical protein